MQAREALEQSKKLPEAEAMPREERASRLKSFLRRLESDLAERGRRSLAAKLAEQLLPGKKKLLGQHVLYCGS